MIITTKGFFYFLNQPLLSEAQAQSIAARTLGTGESTYPAGLNIKSQAGLNE